MTSLKNSYYSIKSNHNADMNGLLRDCTNARRNVHGTDAILLSYTISHQLSRTDHLGVRIS